MKTLIVGLGNPILGDDGAGWKVAGEVEHRLPKSVETSEVSVECLSLGGLSLMERLIGYQRAIVIDAIGTVYYFRLDDLYDPTSGHTTAAHDVSLMTAIQIGRSLGATLPDRIDVVAIESPYVYDFSEELTSPVAAAVPRAVEMVMNLLNLGEDATLAEV